MALDPRDPGEPSPDGSSRRLCASTCREEGLPLGFVETHRLDAVDELGDDLYEAPWLFGMGEVARTLEDDELASGDRLMRDGGVLDGDHSVAPAPEDQGR